MQTVSPARARILAAINPLPAEAVPLDAAVGPVLARPAVAQPDQPPVDPVTMDRLALRYDEYAALERSFPNQETQLAGAPNQ